MGISVVVLTVPRDGSYFKITAEHLRDQRISFTASVGANTDIYNGYNISFAPQCYEPNFSERDLRYRVHCNYINALTIPTYAHEEYRLIVEDDTVICKEFMNRLDVRISYLKKKGKMDVLSLYNNDNVPFGNTDGIHLCPTQAFLGTQAILYPKEFLIPFANYITANIFRLPYDLLLAEFCKENKYCIWKSSLSLVQHIGEITTGLGKFHRSNLFIDDILKTEQ